MTNAMIDGSRAGRAKDQNSPMTSLSPRPWTSRRIIFLGIVGAILAASLTAGVRLMNAHVGEGDARERDAQRMADVQGIVAVVQELYKSEMALPASMAEIEAKAKRRLQVADRQTFEFYEYRVLEPTKFEVCARFETAAAGGPEEHGVGRDCFEVVVG